MATRKINEILVISGKGGTGKTSFAASFAHLAKNTMFCDLDVDAPDMHLLLQPRKLEQHEFWSGNVAFIDENKCYDCEVCSKFCRFNAVERKKEHSRINPINCEGCKLCVELCPCEAIKFISKHSADWYLSQTRFDLFIHARLLPAQENSGRLISLLRKKAKAEAETKNNNFILYDGSPGIGCPVISSLSGISLAVIVTEPTLSGVHDLIRIIDLCDHFETPAVVIINKCDINLNQRKNIKKFCIKRRIEIVGEIAFNEAFVKALVLGKAVTELGLYNLTQQLQNIWNNIINLIEE